MRRSFFRSVFTRLLVAFFSILLVTLLVQSLLLGAIYQANLQQRQQQDMLTFTQNLASSASEVPRVNVGTDFLRSVRSDANFRAVVNNAARQYDSIIWLADAFNNVIQVETGENTLGDQVPDGTIRVGESARFLFDRVFKGETIMIEGTLDGLFRTPMMTVGVPIYSGSTVVGAVITHVQVHAMAPLYALVNWTAVRVAIVASLVGFVLIYGIARRIILPLRQMRNAAGEIAANRFDGPIPVTSDDEVGDLVRAFNRMSEQLRAQEQLRSGFVANVSHELRSPLTSMQGFTQGMLDGTIPREEHPKYLAIIHSETQRLTKLIRELLDLSQIESGKFPLHIRRFDANELIRRVLIRFLDKMEERGIEIDVDFREDYCYVDADTDRIEQVIINLVDNAIKYTPEGGGQISIWTHIAGGKAMISVTDTGMGIPAEDLPYIFERFYKVDKAHTVKTGTGLGLAIVKKIIDQHGGAVTVRSQLGKGTTFMVELPASASQEHAAPEPAEEKDTGDA